MNSEKGLSRLSLGQFTLFSILLQLLPFLLFLLVYGFDNCISYGKNQVCWSGVTESNSYRLFYPYINYFVFFGVLMLNAVQATTKSEFLATAMNALLVVFIWDETEYAFRIIPVEYTLFLFTLTVTMVIRFLLWKRYAKSTYPIDE
jgi:hypothetical protein